GFAQRLQQQLALFGADLRQRGGCAEGARQPGPDLGSQEALVEEAIGGEALDPLLRQVEGGDAEQRADEAVHPFERVLARPRAPQRLQFLVGDILPADLRAFLRIAGPELEGVLPAEADVEAALDVTLLCGSEAGKFAQFGDGQRSGIGGAHWCTPEGSIGASSPNVVNAS